MKLLVSIFIEKIEKIQKKKNKELKKKLKLLKKEIEKWFLLNIIKIHTN